MVELKNKPPLDSEVSVKETFKSLSTKKKFEFIYDYYKLPIISVLLGILIITYITYSIYTKQDTYCNITYYNSNINTDELYNLKDTLNETILSDNKKSTIMIDSIFVDASSNYGDDPTSTQNFAVKLAANEIDILIVNKNYFSHLATNDMLLDLNSLTGFSSLGFDEDSLISSKNSSGKEILYGIKVDNLNLLNTINFNSDDTILAIAISSQRTEETLKVLSEFVK